MYIVMTATEKMPASCWGRYRRVAVVRLEDGFTGEPKMISERARGLAEIVEEWRACSVGTTDRSAYRRAVAEAEALAARLNG